MSKWDTVKSRLSNIPTVNNVQRRKNTIKRRNTTYYRTYMRQKAINNNLQEETLLDPKYDYLVNPKLFKNIQLISEPDNSSSNSLVYKMVGPGDYQYILKVTILKEGVIDTYNSVNSESDIYNIMSFLVKENITPHVFQYSNSIMDVDLSSLQLRRPLFRSISKFIHKEVNAAIKYRYQAPNFTHVCALLTETSHGDVKLISFKDLKDKLYEDFRLDDDTKYQIMINILFQILYTLHVFNKIRLKHNDLHNVNIFIIKRKLNMLDHNDAEPFNRKYIFDDGLGKIHDVILPNIGLDVRIYDFDRSVKQPTPNFKFHPGTICHDGMKRFESVNQDCSDNVSHDTYKILCHIMFSKYVQSNLGDKRLKNLIEILFPSPGGKEILRTGKKNYTNVEYIKRDGYRYYLLGRPLTHQEMYPTEQILVILKGTIDTLPRVFPEITETFSTQYLEKSFTNSVHNSIRSLKKSRRNSKISKLPKLPKISFRKSRKSRKSRKKSISELSAIPE